MVRVLFAYSFLLFLLDQIDSETRKPLPNKRKRYSDEFPQRCSGQQDQIIGIGMPDKCHTISGAQSYEFDTIGQRTGHGNLFAIANLVSPLRFYYLLTQLHERAHLGRIGGELERRLVHYGCQPAVFHIPMKPTDLDLTPARPI
jgi:hypothetical protein